MLYRFLYIATYGENREDLVAISVFHSCDVDNRRPSRNFAILFSVKMPDRQTEKHCNAYCVVGNGMYETRNFSSADEMDYTRLANTTCTDHGYKSTRLTSRVPSALFYFSLYIQSVKLIDIPIHRPITY